MKISLKSSIIKSFVKNSDILSGEVGALQYVLITLLLPLFVFIRSRAPVVADKEHTTRSRGQEVMLAATGLEIGNKCILRCHSVALSSES